MRGVLIVMAALVASLSPQGAGAQQSDYSGRWLFSGLINGGRSLMSFAQICDLAQTGVQIAGPCHGPNGACSIVGVVNQGSIDLTCRGGAPSNPSTNGILTFHGDLAPDGVVRGACSHTRIPGAPGQASLMRI